MYIAAIEFVSYNDIHLIAGQTSADLINGNQLVLIIKMDDGTTFKSGQIKILLLIRLFLLIRFSKELLTIVGPNTFCEGFGIRVNKTNGSVTVTNPLPAIRKYNFILEVKAENTSLPATSTERVTTTFIRIHVHQSISSIWLTPAQLTIRQYIDSTVTPFPQETIFKFAVHAQFDDACVGNITSWPGLTWGPAGRINASTGHLIILATDKPGNTFTVTAGLPASLGGLSTAPATVRLGDSWMSGSVNYIDIVPGGGWPGIIEPGGAPNILFLGDGYGSTDTDKEFFKDFVGTIVSYVKQDPTVSPYNILATSMNFWCAFLPSDAKGVTISGEVFPQVFDGVQYAYFVPRPTAPAADATEWNPSEVIYAVGLPVTKDATGIPMPFDVNNPPAALDDTFIQNIRNVWASQLTSDPNPHITDKNTIVKWLSLAARSLVDAVDTPLAIAGGNPTSDTTYNDIDFDANRMTRSILDGYLGTLATESGIDLRKVWITGANDFDLVCIIPAGIGRANNADGYFFATPLGFDKLAIKQRPGSSAFMLDTTNIILPASADNTMSRTFAHELAHSFAIGDEYWQVDATYPYTSVPVDNLESNIESADSVMSVGAIDGDQIKWNWHRIYKAAELNDVLSEISPSQWNVPLISGQGAQFVAGDTVHFRFRIYMKKLEKFPKISVPLTVLTVTNDSLTVGLKTPATDAVYPTALVYPVASLIQAIDFISTFIAGCIVYIPKPAPASIKNQVYCAEMVALNIKTFITANHRALTDASVVTKNSEDQQPNFNFSGALSVPALPDCFSRNRPRIVGLYDGGNMYRKGIYHPTGHCIMKSSRDSTEFCAVCRYILVDMIDPYMHFDIDLMYDKLYPQR